MRPFKVGERVKITQSNERFKNNKHGYNNSMKQYMGTETFITEIDSYEDIIRVDNNTWSWDEETIDHLF